MLKTKMTNEPNLSLLVPTVGPRCRLLNRLLYSLENQIEAAELTRKIEILLNWDDFQKTIGQKRNELLQAATGRFVCFLDDDDMVHPKYCSLVNDVIETDDYDCIAYKKMRIGVSGQKHPNFHLCNRENPCDICLMPVRRHIAQQFEFPNISTFEDCTWGNKVQASGLLKREYFIDKMMYVAYRNPELRLSGVRHKKKRNIEANENFDWEERPLKGMAKWL